MQIGAATQFANGSANMSTGDTSTASDQAAQDAAQASDNSTNATSSSSQDDAGPRARIFIRTRVTIPRWREATGL